MISVKSLPTEQSHDQQDTHTTHTHTTYTSYTHTLQNPHTPLPDAEVQGPVVAIPS